ncbi:MAG TPA: hypothetical protein VFA04_20460 [Bryobacteraceae bacterium]|nr:hypothetical protein [Bryobacteraceae bacterium]
MGPQLFGPGVISTEDDESGGVLSPDGNEFYFVRNAPYTTSPALSVICVSHRRGLQWSEPQALPFSGQFWNRPPRLSPDGNTMLFGSSRPMPVPDGGGMHLWRSRRTASGWSVPEPMPAPINGPGGSTFDASMAADGTLYMTRASSEGYHIAASRLVNGQYTTPELMPPPVRSPKQNVDVEPFIAPDQSYLVFVSQWIGPDPHTRRPEELIAGGSPYPRGDLYITYRRHNGWTQPRHLANGVNSFAEESFPSVSPDGRWLFFSSERSMFEVPVPRLTWARLEREWPGIFNGRGNIYRIDMAQVKGE